MSRRASSRTSTPDRGGHPAPPPGSQDSVTTEAILARLARAEEIQAELAEADARARQALQGRSGQPPADAASDEKERQALRLALCEALTEVLVTDPGLAAARDAVGRLWKHCFYERIADLRSRLAREKKRKKGGAGARPDAVRGARSKAKAVEIEKQLQQFLREAVNLYQFLIERYVRDLEESHDDDDGGSHEGDHRRALVAALYRMHIHLGDLHRYGDAHAEAEGCYLTAARLAPGTGNPYNQLAVVAQQGQDLAVVALYYYARALMAAREPFETSRANLVRLFEGNRRRLEERGRDAGAPGGRGIVEVGDDGEGGAPVGPRKTAAKKHREWQAKERAALNRTTLMRLVDLTWCLFQGVSLEDDPADRDRIDLAALADRMSALRDPLAHLVGRAGLSETLLCRVVAVLAFGTLGAGHRGRLLAAEDFYARREKDPGWNEGVLVANQALACAFFLRACAALAEDAAAALARRREGDGGRPGAVRSLAPLALGARYASCLYNDECRWFHGRGFFPHADADAAGDGEDGGSVRRLCREAHADFWGALAALATRLEALPGARRAEPGAGAPDPRDVKDLGEFRGYAPFSSFLDGDAADGAPGAGGRTRYAPAEEALEALAERKRTGGGGGAEAEAARKVRLLLAIADRHARPAPGAGAADDGQRFLTRDAATRAWEFDGGGAEDAEDAEDAPEGRDRVPEELASAAFVTDPDRADAGAARGRENGAGRADAAARGAAEDVAVPLRMSYSGQGMALLADAAARGAAEDVAVPLRMSYSGQGMALLTPAALLAGGAADTAPKTVAVHSTPLANKTPAVNHTPAPPSLDAILANGLTALPPTLGSTAATLDTGAFLSTALRAHPPPSLRPPPGPAATAPPGLPPGLPPPPGFSRQPPPAPARPPAPSATGISLASFTLPAPGPVPTAHHAAFGAPYALPGVAPSYPAYGALPTMNPFARPAPPPPAAFHGNFIAAHANPGPPQPPGLLPPALGGGFPGPHHASNPGLDPTLDFLLHNGGAAHAAARAPSRALEVPPPAFHEPEDPSESILKLLFEPHGLEAAAYERPQHHPSPSAPHGRPRTDNPFAT